MNRRSFLMSVPVFTAFLAQASAAEDALALAFNRLSQVGRVAVQEKMVAGGFYNGGLDGAFGSGTKRSLIDAASFVKSNSYGKVVFDLSTDAGANEFLKSLSNGSLDKYLWGEGDESE